MSTILFLLACSSTPDDTAADTAEAVDPLGGTAPLAPVSDGAWPAGVAAGGEVTLTSNGKTRSVQVLLPASGAEGKPVVFVWHPLGGTAQDMIRWLRLRSWVDEVDAVVVAPDALASSMWEWGFFGDATDDLTLYDDLRTCLVQDLGVDATRFSATGMSAGALWTTYLALHRGDTLATVAPFSGGTPNGILAYEAPAGPMPVVLFHGGETDIYGGGLVDFYEATYTLADGLVDDGHFVVLCDHGGGHTLPAEARDAMSLWLPGQVYGEPTPFEQGDVTELAPYCDVYTGG